MDKPDGENSHGGNFNIPFTTPPSAVVQRNLLICVTGTSAAAETIDLVNGLKEVALVCVLCTENALKYFKSMDLENPRLLFTDIEEASYWHRNQVVLHEFLAGWAELIIVVPTSCNTLSKVALGLCDNLLTNTLKAFKGPVHFIPDMSSGMYDAITKQQIKDLEARGYGVLLPSAVGRMDTTTNVTAFIREKVLQLGKHKE